MTNDFTTVVSAAKSNQDFSCSAWIKDDQPEITPINSDQSPTQDVTDDEKVDIVAAQSLKRFRPAFEELAK